MLDTYRDLSATATFNQWVGLEVVRMDEGECELRMRVRRQHHGARRRALIARRCQLPRPAVGEEFHASGRVVKAGRKQIFTAGELSAVHDRRSKLVATASVILVPTGD